MTFDCYFLPAKSGVEPALCLDLVKHITNCSNLEFSGLMTIGMLDYSSTPENFKVATVHSGHDLFVFLGLPIYLLFKIILRTKYSSALSRCCPIAELKFVKHLEYQKRNVSYQWA